MSSPLSEEVARVALGECAQALVRVPGVRPQRLDCRGRLQDFTRGLRKSFGFGYLSPAHREFDKRPQVAGHAIAEQPRREVGELPHVGGRVSRVSAGADTQQEVREVGIALTIEQHVGRSQVPMYDALTVGKRQR